MGRHRIVRRAMSGWVMACALTGATPGLAEDSAPAEEAVIDEIVVTALKREQPLVDVGVSVTAFTGLDLEELGLAEPADLAAQTPNLNANVVFGNSIPNISIRGIGLNDYAVNNNAAVGVYADEVYLVSPAMLSFQLFDLERVEVLKGPQGTLYGRNTTAGAINFVSRRPEEEFDGYFEVGYGNLDRTQIGGAVSGRIADGVSARLAFRADRQGRGHQRNRATGKSVGEVDRVSWRGMIRFQPAEGVDILGEWHSGRDRSDTLLLKVNNIFTPEDDAFFPGDPFSSAGRPDTFMDVESDGGVLTARWSPTDGLTFTSITAAEEFSRRHVEDRDGTTLSHLDGTFANEIEQFSQEVRVTWERDDLVLIAGAIFASDEVETRDLFETDDFFAAGIFPFRAVGNEYRQETDSKAAFVNLEWQSSPAWRLTGGLRYTDEDKDFSNAFTFIYIDALPGAGGFEIGIFPPVQEEYAASDVSGRIGLDYTGWENALLYFSLAKGFKSGNFQGQLTFNPADLAPFEEEEVLSYELGFKGRLADNAMLLTGSVFFYDYRGLQIYGSIYTEPIDPLFGIDNVGDAEVRGAELDLSWQLNADLGVHVGIGLLDTEVTKSVLSPVASGSRLPNAPEVNFNVRLDYSRNLTPGLTFELLAHASYKDEVAYDIVRAPRETIEDGYWLANLRLALRPSGEREGWQLSLWGRNLFDEEYRAQVLTSTVGWGETWGMPRTYGVNLSYRW